MQEGAAEDEGWWGFWAPRALNVELMWSWLDPFAGGRVRLVCICGGQSGAGEAAACGVRGGRGSHAAATHLRQPGLRAGWAKGPGNIMGTAEAVGLISMPACSF